MKKNFTLKLRNRLHIAHYHVGNGMRMENVPSELFGLREWPEDLREAVTKIHALNRTTGEIFVTVIQ